LGFIISRTGFTFAWEVDVIFIFDANQRVLHGRHRRGDFCFSSSNTAKKKVCVPARKFHGSIALETVWSIIPVRDFDDDFPRRRELSISINIARRQTRLKFMSSENNGCGKCSTEPAAGNQRAARSGRDAKSN
jgi:hypothetical protein